MAALKVAGSCQIMWRFVAGMLALFCAIGLARSGYGQVDQVGELISELKYSDPGVRLNAVQALARIGDGRVTEPLIASLSDTDPEVRESAAFGLGGIRDLKAVEPLIVSLKDSDGRVRRGAVTALGMLKDLRAVEPLIAALKDPDPQVRHAAVGALKHIGDRRAAEPLRLALNDPEYYAQNETVLVAAQDRTALVKVDAPPPPTTNALIYIYQRKNIEAYEPHILIDGRFLPDLYKATYTFYEVATPPQTIVFTSKNYIPAHPEIDFSSESKQGDCMSGIGSNANPCRVTHSYVYHMEPGRSAPDSTLLSFQVQAGGTYYFRYEKGAIKQVDEAIGAKEMRGLRLVALPTPFSLVPAP